MINYDALYLDLLQDLSLSYDQDLTLDPWDSESTVARKQLARSFLKKCEDLSKPSNDDAALDKFLRINNASQTWKLSPETMSDTILLSYFKGWTTKVFSRDSGLSLVQSYSEVLDLGRNGPGSTIGVNNTDFYSKLFDSRLSTTKSVLYRIYADYVSNHPLWNDAEEIRLKHRGDSDIVAGNRLRFVPKNDTTSRVTCTEPLLNMFFQLGLGACIDRRIEAVFNNCNSVQPQVNRDLARLGSLSDSLVTLDLESASDSMSMSMLSEFLPHAFFSMLVTLRSPQTTLPDGREVELHMVSTMGNGFTFSLLNGLMCCVVAACFDASGKEMVNNPFLPGASSSTANWAVFGDDIIVPTSVSQKVCRLLTLLGFQVNRSKSYEIGPFRESCGFDSWNGSNVRGVYIKTLKTPQDRYVAINLLLEWVGRSKIELPLTIRHLLRTVPRIAVPLWENADSGIRVPYRFLTYICSLPKKDRNGTILYRKYVSVPSRYKISDNLEVIGPKGLSPRFSNEPGLLCSFLQGSLVGVHSNHLLSKGIVGEIHFRSKVNRYTTKQGKAPSWETCPTMRTPFEGYVGGSGAKAPVLSNLLSSW